MKLNIKDTNNNVYVKDAISNIKNNGVFTHNAAGDQRLFILTNDGKLYVMKDLINKPNSINFENIIIEEIVFNTKIDLIGYTFEYLIEASIANHLVVKSNNKD